MNEQKGFLLLSIAVLGVISFLLVRPFLGYLLGSIILAFILHPLQKKTRSLVGETISAFLLVVFSVLMVVVPLLFIGAAVLEDARQLSDTINDTQVVDIGSIEEMIEGYTGREVDIQESIRATVDRFTGVALGNLSQLLGMVVEASLGFTLMLFVLYYLLKDGEGVVKWMKETTPMPRDIQESLYSRVNDTTWAVIKGHVLVAVIQGLVAGVGLAVAGIPNYFFWTFIMVLLGFIPIIGTIVVWLPASIYLMLIGRTGPGMFLMVYGFLVVSFTDNIFRPLAVERGADLHPAAILIGVLGGVYLFGAAGLFIGPIIIGVLKSVLLVFRNNYEDL